MFFDKRKDTERKRKGPELKRFGNLNEPYVPLKQTVAKTILDDCRLTGGNNWNYWHIIRNGWSSN